MILSLLIVALAGPLHLDEVLASVDARVPQLAAAEARLDAAEASRLAARGAFDPVLTAGARRPVGDDGSEMGVGLSGQTALGPTWSVGWREARGPWADDPGSEWSGRVSVPLLDGLSLGGDRVDLLRSEAELAGAEQSLEAARLALRASASEAYWRWVAAGAKRAVRAELLSVAEARLAGLEREVTSGQRARIDLVDNERVLFERRDALLEAEAEVEAAAQGLSLYFRSDTGAPVRPEVDQLPADLLDAFELGEETADLGSVAGHPLVQQARARLDAVEISVRGARNALLPDLSVSVEQVVGGGGSETVGGVDLTVPLLFRSDRGKLARERAELSRADQELRQLTDQLRAEVLALRAAVSAGQAREDATREARARAEEVARLERRRFELGGSELFTLLLREEAVARASLDAVDASLAARIAEARLAALAVRPSASS